jgi:hypothetical protein
MSNWNDRRVPHRFGHGLLTTRYDHNRIRSKHTKIRIKRWAKRARRHDGNDDT